MLFCVTIACTHKHTYTHFDSSVFVEESFFVCLPLANEDDGRPALNVTFYVQLVVDLQICVFVYGRVQCIYLLCGCCPCTIFHLDSFALVHCIARRSVCVCLSRDNEVVVRMQRSQCSCLVMQVPAEITAAAAGTDSSIRGKKREKGKMLMQRGENERVKLECGNRLVYYSSSRSLI